MPAAGGVHADDPVTQRQVDVVMQAAKVIVAAVANSLAAVDSIVTMPQLRVLVMVSERGPLNLSAVANGLGVNPSNASRMCERLVAELLLDRREDETDRRHVSLTVTPKGDRLVDTVMRHRRSVLEQVVTTMAPGERRRLEGCLDAFVGAAGRLSAQGRLGDPDGQLPGWMT